MHDLPDAVFGAHDQRNPQSEGSDGHLSAKPGLGPLHPHNVGKLRSYTLRYVLNVNKPAISSLRCGALDSRNNLLPSTYDRAKGVSEGHVFRWDHNIFTGSGFPFRNSPAARSYLLDQFGNVVFRRHLDLLPFNRAYEA
jgi:hypothetical protein